MAPQRGTRRPMGDRLAETERLPNIPEDRAEAAKVLRCPIEKIALRPGNGRGKPKAMLFGVLGNIPAWTERWTAGKPTKSNTPIVGTMGVSVMVVAGTGFEPVTFRL